MKQYKTGITRSQRKQSFGWTTCPRIQTRSYVHRKMRSVIPARALPSLSIHTACIQMAVSRLASPRAPCLRCSGGLDGSRSVCASWFPPWEKSVCRPMPAVNTTPLHPCGASFASRPQRRPAALHTNRKRPTHNQSSTPAHPMRPQPGAPNPPAYLTGRRLPQTPAWDARPAGPPLCTSAHGTNGEGT